MLPLTWNDISKGVNFYIMPYLQQKWFLGVDFWKQVQVGPEVISSLESH